MVVESADTQRFWYLDSLWGWLEDLNASKTALMIDNAFSGVMEIFAKALRI